MNINQKQMYQIAKEHGFYQPHETIEDRIMGIVSEIGEAYEEFRIGNTAKSKGLGFTIGEIAEKFDATAFKQYFIIHYLGTFEDELADIIIRLYNFASHYEIEVVLEDITLSEIDSWNKIFCSLVLLVCDLSLTDPKYSQLSFIVNFLVFYCKKNNIDIESHIKAKTLYNEGREELHGKLY